MFLMLLMPLLQRLNTTIDHWRRRFQTACNPYRPELHYMRGPGPKWHAKHQRRTNSGAP